MHPENIIWIPHNLKPYCDESWNKSHGNEWGFISKWRIFSRRVSVFKKALSVTYHKPVEGTDFRFLSNEKFEMSLTGVLKIDSDHYHIFLKKFLTEPHFRSRDNFECTHSNFLY